MLKNIAESKRLKKAIRAKPKQCYANAWRAIETQEEYRDATYVEGAAVRDHVLVLEHGWIVREGEIIDPTLPDGDLAYFPGLQFEGRKGLEGTWRIPGLLESGLKLPVFYRFGWGGVASPEFRNAMVAAYRFAGHDLVAESYLRAAERAREQPAVA
jgi:hypothetical protein